MIDKAEERLTQRLSRARRASTRREIMRHSHLDDNSKSRPHSPHKSTLFRKTFAHVGRSQQRFALGAKNEEPPQEDVDCEEPVTRETSSPPLFSQTRERYRNFIASHPIRIPPELLSPIAVQPPKAQGCAPVRKPRLSPKTCPSPKRSPRNSPKYSFGRRANSAFLFRSSSSPHNKTKASISGGSVMESYRSFVASHPTPIRRAGGAFESPLNKPASNTMERAKAAVSHSTPRRRAGSAEGTLKKPENRAKGGAKVALSHPKPKRVSSADEPLNKPGSNTFGGAKESDQAYASSHPKSKRGGGGDASGNTKPERNTLGNVKDGYRSFVASLPKPKRAGSDDESSGKAESFTFENVKESCRSIVAEGRRLVSTRQNARPCTKPDESVSIGRSLRPWERHGNQARRSLDKASSTFPAPNMVRNTTPPTSLEQPKKKPLSLPPRQQKKAQSSTPSQQQPRKAIQLELRKKTVPMSSKPSLPPSEKKAVPLSIRQPTAKQSILSQSPPQKKPAALSNKPPATEQQFLTQTPTRKTAVSAPPQPSAKENISSQPPQPQKRKVVPVQHKSSAREITLSKPPQLLPNKEVTNVPPKPSPRKRSAPMPVEHIRKGMEQMKCKGSKETDNDLPTGVSHNSGHGRMSKFQKLKSRVERSSLGENHTIEREHTISTILGAPNDQLCPSPKKKTRVSAKTVQDDESNQAPPSALQRRCARRLTDKMLGKAPNRQSPYKPMELPQPTKQPPSLNQCISPFNSAKTTSNFQNIFSQKQNNCSSSGSIFNTKQGLAKKDHAAIVPSSLETSWKYKPGGPSRLNNRTHSFQKKVQQQQQQQPQQPLSAFAQARAAHMANIQKAQQQQHQHLPPKTVGTTTTYWTNNNRGVPVGKKK